MRTKPPIPLEREIQANGIKALATLGIILYRRNVALQVATHNGKSRAIRSGEPGQSDTYGWHKETGKHIEIEWKRPGKRPTQKQLAWLQNCGRNGAIAFWADDVSVAMKVASACLHGFSIVWDPYKPGDFDLK